ncbi:MAG: hypothetical protein ABIJ37_06410 [Pseudomonadota bacterium]
MRSIYIVLVYSSHSMAPEKSGHGSYRTGKSHAMVRQISRRVRKGISYNRFTFVSSMLRYSQRNSFAGAGRLADECAVLVRTVGHLYFKPNEHYIIMGKVVGTWRNIKVYEKK